MASADWTRRQTRITALADDATGALETGCRLSSNGVPSEVWFAPPAPDRRRSLVIDTQSRHCAPAEARSRVRQALGLVRDPGWIFKKTDSTLRGNIAAEIAGILDRCNCRTVVYVPAYPAMGRTVVNGRLFVYGVPVEQTAFSRDPLFPVRCGSVCELFRDCALEAVNVRKPGELMSLLRDADRQRVLICDGSADEDIEEAARAVATSQGTVAAAGPAPFAGALARRLSAGLAGAESSPRAGRGLIVCGSLHPASLEQVDYAVASGIPIAASAAQAATALTRHNWAILRLPERPGLKPCEAAEMLARAAREVMRKAALDALILFGGETAYSILRHLKVRYVEPERELLTGVSLSRTWTPHPLTLVAKAGGFGPPTVIQEILRQLDPPPKQGDAASGSM